MMQHRELSRQIRDWIVKNQQNPFVDAVEVDDRIDLIASGALDSMAFIELLVHIESITGEKIDLGELDPSEFTTIDGLARSVLNHKKPA